MYGCEEMVHLLLSMPTQAVWYVTEACMSVLYSLQPNQYFKRMVLFYYSISNRLVKQIANKIWEIGMLTDIGFSGFCKM